MPELPEVETIRRALHDGGRQAPPVVGRKIRGAYLLWAGSLAEPGPEQFLCGITGQSILDVDRRGKFLIIILSDDFLIFHLRMSGDLVVKNHSSEADPHDRLILDLDDGHRLVFNDPRKFGRAWFVADPYPVLKKLGPEPLEEGLTAEQFHQRLKTHRRQLKPLLLDQTFIAGLGNIYADEALHLTGLHPLMVSNDITEIQAEKLLESIRTVLTEGILRQGASIDWVYRGGDFQNYFRVYQRTNQPCLSCGTPIVRIVVGQRGTHYCPTCQPL